MSFDADTIIIGAGTCGAAAAWALSRRGHRVIALDGRSPPHTSGEHHGVQRMFRTAYYEHPDYVPLLRRAFRGWREIERASGRDLLFATGAYYIGRMDGELAPGSLGAATLHGIPHRRLGEAEVASELPMFRPPAGCIGLFEEPAGYVRCEEAVGAMLGLAKAGGVRVRTNEIVRSWSASSAGVRVQTAGGELTASALVIAAGPGSGELLAETGVRLTVTRQVQAWARPGTAMPECCWAMELPAGGLLYGFPARDGEFKFGLHVRGVTVGADDPPEAGAHELAVLERALAEYLPGTIGPTRTSVCRYTNSPDSHFIIDRHPAHANVVFGAGFSGHGFKFAPVIGEMLADLVLSAGSSHPAPFLGLARFGSIP